MLNLRECDKCNLRMTCESGKQAATVGCITYENEEEKAKNELWEETK